MLYCVCRGTVLLTPHFPPADCRAELGRRPEILRSQGYRTLGEEKGQNDTCISLTAGVWLVERHLIVNSLWTTRVSLQLTFRSVDESHILQEKLTL